MIHSFSAFISTTNNKLRRFVCAYINSLICFLRQNSLHLSKNIVIPTHLKIVLVHQAEEKFNKANSTEYGSIN